MKLQPLIMKKTLLIILLLPIISYSQWSQIGSNIDAEGQVDNFGTTVAINSIGDIVAIGGNLNDGNGSNSGHVRVFKNISNVWTQIGNDIDGEAAGDESGTAISLNSLGDIVAIGASGNDDGGSSAGHVRVFQNISNVWTQIGSDLDGASAGDFFGASVSLNIDGNILAIGISQESTTLGSGGQVKIYENISGVWTQTGNDINGNHLSGEFGSAVKLSADGTIVAVSTPGAQDEKGVVKVYKNIANTWTQIGIDIVGIEDYEYSGITMSLSANGNRVAIGAPYINSDSGQTRVYENQGGTWIQLGGFINGEAAGDAGDGMSVTLSDDGNTIAVGDASNSGSGSFGQHEGNIKVYQFISNNWVQLGVDIPGIEDEEKFGSSVDFNSDASVLISGIPRAVVNSYHSGSVRVYSAGALNTPENNFNEPLSLYPNPTTGKVTVQLNQSFNNIDIIVKNILGQTVSSFKSSSTDKVTFSINGNSGLYFVQISNEEGNNKILKIIKQ